MADGKESLKPAALQGDTNLGSPDVSDANHGGSTPITSKDIFLIADSRKKKSFLNLSKSELRAYSRVTQALQSLGHLAVSQLSHRDKFLVRTTVGFNLKNGIKTKIPRDLWVTILLKENVRGLGGIPQLFIIVSERGIEFGYSASVSPRDIAQTSHRKAVQRAAPRVFGELPEPDSAEARELQVAIEAGGPWCFRRKQRLKPKETDFSNLTEWLRYLKSPDGETKAAGAISRYLQVDEIDKVDLEAEIARMVSLFEPLLDRNWFGTTTSRHVDDYSDLNLNRLAKSKDRPLLFNEAVNFDKEVIFIAVPKAGTTSIRAQLAMQGTMLIPNPHLTILQVRDALYTFFLLQSLGSNASFPTLAHDVESDAEVRIRAAEVFKNYFKIASVRNPYARVVSLYSRHEGIKVTNKMSFDTFCENLKYASDTCQHPTRAANQLDWITDETGQLAVDYVLRLEDLAAGFQDIYELTKGRIDLQIRDQNRNPASRSRSYHDIYTENSRSIVAELFRRDIEFFDYEF